MFLLYSGTSLFFIYFFTRIFTTLLAFFFSVSKSNIPKNKVVDSVYKMNCNDCACCYMGKSSQYISESSNQHMYSSLTVQNHHSLKSLFNTLIVTIILEKFAYRS